MLGVWRKFQPNNREAMKKDFANEGPDILQQDWLKSQPTCESSLHQRLVYPLCRLEVCPDQYCVVFQSERSSTQGLQEEPTLSVQHATVFSTVVNIGVSTWVQGWAHANTSQSRPRNSTQSESSTNLACRRNRANTQLCGLDEMSRIPVPHCSEY